MRRLRRIDNEEEGFKCPICLNEWIPLTHKLPHPMNLIIFRGHAVSIQVGFFDGTNFFYYDPYNHRKIKKYPRLVKFWINLAKLKKCIGT